MDITWKEWLATARGRGIVLFCMATLVAMILFMPFYYSQLLGPKPGTLLNDWVLNLFVPVDWSNAVFFILGVALLQTLIQYSNKPAVLLAGVMTYCVVNILRAFTMYTVTLEPPVDMILLIDPISAYFVYPEQAFAKDLFFSGHISTMMATVFVERNRVWYMVKLFGTALMALFLAWQHVHYTVDLVAAPLIAWLAYRGVVWYISGVPVKKPLE